MVEYTTSISKYILLVGFINLVLLISIYFYNKKENNKMYFGLAIIYSIIQIGYRLFLYFFNSYGIIGSISKISLAHLYYDNIIALVISVILCFITSFYILKQSYKFNGNINYIGILLILVGLYTGVL